MNMDMTMTMNMNMNKNAFGCWLGHDSLHTHCLCTLMRVNLYERSESPVACSSIRSKLSRTALEAVGRNLPSRGFHIPGGEGGRATDASEYTVTETRILQQFHAKAYTSKMRLKREMR